MSGGKLFPNSLFKNRKQGSTDSNDSRDNDEREQRKRAALDMVKVNSNAMNKSTEPKVKKSVREKSNDDIFDVPATQVSPTKGSRRSFDFPTPIVVDKGLKRLQKQDRHSMSMVSSPSMMKPKPVEPERKQPKTADAIFEELKKSEVASQAVAKVAAETKSDQKSTGSTSDDDKDKMQVDEPAPVVAPTEESRDWTKITPESLRALQESTQSLRFILEELKKANEKITEFRQAIVKEV